MPWPTAYWITVSTSAMVNTSLLTSFTPIIGVSSIRLAGMP